MEPLPGCPFDNVVDLLAGVEGVEERGEGPQVERRGPAQSR